MTIGEQAKLYIEEKLEDREFRRQQKEEERETNRSYRECIKNLERERKQAKKQAREERTGNKDVRQRMSAQYMAEDMRDELDATLAGKENPLRAQVKVSQEFLRRQNSIYQAQSPQDVEVLIAEIENDTSLSNEEKGILFANATRKKFDLENNLEGPQQPATPQQEQGENDEVYFDIK